MNPPAAAIGGAVVRALQGLGASLARRLSDERDRWTLWLPVGIGIGIAVYFALPAEPPLLAGPLAMVAAGAGGFAGRRHLAGLALFVGILSIAVGFTAASLRTAMVTAPVLTRPINAASVTGRVELVERVGDGARVTVVAPVIDKLPAGRTPYRVRMRFAPSIPPPLAGTVVRLRGSLLPAAGPAEPGAYDFQRAAFFAGIGAVGFAYAPAEVVESQPAGILSGFFAATDRLRGRIEAMVHAVADGPAVPVTISLLNGEQTGISEPVMVAMRASGLAHILSISGLHIALVAGLVFALARAILALIEPLALRWPIKKIAAVVGVLAAFSYTLVVGTPVPTLRSELMTGMVMLAILADRQPMSPRVFATVAVVVMLLYPEEMMGPSFQMSFAAVGALIFGFEMAQAPIRRWRTTAKPVMRGVIDLSTLALTSVIATIATLPFSLFHFQNITFYGVVANMLAVPLTTFWIMPLGLFSYLLMPFGVEGPVLIAMNWGSEVLVWIARTVTAWPHALTLVPAMPDWGLPALALSGCWLCLWRTRWRLLGLPVFLVGLLSPALTVRPDLLISDDGHLIAVRGADGRLSPSKARGDRIAISTWIRRDGATTPADPWPLWGSAAGGRLTCDPLGCLYRKDGHTAALIRDPLAADEDCLDAEVVVTPTQVRGCDTAVVIDPSALARDGAEALTFTPDGLRRVTTRQIRGERPWTGHPPGAANHVAPENSGVLPAD